MLNCINVIVALLFFHVFVKMLTCINPAVSFRMKANTERGMYSGVAVALKWLLLLIKQFGGTYPPEDRMRQEIRTLSIGDTSDKKQYFNKFTNGTTITRAAGGVEVTARSCVLIKYEAFQPESKRAFRKGMNHIKPTLFSSFIQPCVIYV